MKIGLVVEQFDPRRGGLEQWAAQFAAEMSHRGHEIHVVTRRLAEAAVRPSVVGHIVDAPRSRLAFARAAEMTLCRLDLDVIHDTGAGICCDVLHPHGGTPLALWQQKLLLLPRWFRPWKRVARQLLPRYREMAALCRRQFVADGRVVLALSQRVAAELHRYHQVAPPRICLVYNGVDTGRFAPDTRERWRQTTRRELGVGDRTVLFLIVAHNFRLKGVRPLVQAMGRLAAMGRAVHLAVVGGKAKHLAAYRALAARHGASASVSFVGSVEDTVPYYAAADVYVQPTFYDPCSLVAMEALASGLPVVTSQFNGVAELMTEGIHGSILADPADVHALTTRLHAMLDGSLRDRMGDAARKLALQHTFHAHCDRIEAVYQAVAGSQRRAA